MTVLEQMLEQTGSVVILGHVRPDGDCLGSTLGLYHYIQTNYPAIRAAVYLEESSPKFGYLAGYDAILHETDEERYELCICLDCGDEERLGSFGVFLANASKSLCLDHHITNTRFCEVNLVSENASSTCEVLFEQLDEEKIDKAAAECLYTGLIHDTGVFKYSCTSACTMEIAGKLMAKGIDFGSIIDNSFYKKTYVQNQILGRALLESITFLDGKCIFSALRQSEMEFYGVNGKDMDGIIDQLRLTEGVEVAIFMYQTGPQEFKVSLRSQNAVDVSRIASYFGGGGHVRAAGCTMSGRIHDVVNNLSLHIAKQLDAAGPQEE
jgi:phosphoesterase RecJ-like protein